MKKTFLIPFAAALLLIAPKSLYSDEGRTVQQRYIDKYAPVAVAEMKRTGVPASITLAQGLVESGAGLSSLAVKGNNHFGIKCHNDWNGRKMFKDDDARRECFRVYGDASESFRDHSDFLRFRDRYKFLFDLKPTDYKAWALGLKRAGYATDPAYSAKLIKQIEDYHLDKYDVEVLQEEIPMTPEAIEQGSTVIVQDPASVSKKSEIKENLTFGFHRPVYANNGVSFVYSTAGETYESIASSYGLFRKEILGYNDVSVDIATELPEGTRVYIQPKKNRSSKGLNKYVVDTNGESLRDISQRFAVKVSAIVKLNSLPEGYVPKEGDMLVLRK